MNRLVRTFVLLDSLHGLKPSDVALLKALRENAISHQIVLSKVDRILKLSSSVKSAEYNTSKLLETFKTFREAMEAIEVPGPKPLGEIVACSTMQSTAKGIFLGINQLRWSILVATGFGERRKVQLSSERLVGENLPHERAPSNSVVSE